MAPSISITGSPPKAPPSNPLPDPDDFAIDSRNSTSDTRVLLPRYADSDLDSDSVPSSPASIESFEFSDSPPWRHSHSRNSSSTSSAYALDSKHRRSRSTSFPPRYSSLRARRTLILCLLLAAMLIASGGVFGAMKARQYEKVRLRRECENRAGGEKCRLSEGWAKCVSANGLGFCQAEIGDEIGGLRE